MTALQRWILPPTLRCAVAERPTGVRAWVGGEELRLVEASSPEERVMAEPASGTATWLFEGAPAVETFAPTQERVLAAMVAGVHGAPRVTVRLPRANASEAPLRVVLLG